MKDFITIKDAIKTLNADGVVAIPTETVYGLAAKINSEVGLKKIFEIKNRPLFDPLIVHISNLEMMKNYILNPEPILLSLADKFWPGPLTLIFKKNQDTVSDLITAGSETVALRWPKHLITQKIITELEVPIAAPSANPFKKTSPSDAEHVRTYFPNLDIIDGGPCDVGLESTIVRLNEGKLEILRPGFITKTEIESFLKAENQDYKVTENFDQTGPGSMKEHYQPDSPLYLFINKKINFNLFKSIKYRIIPLDADPRICSRYLYKNLIENSKTSEALIIEWDKDTNDTNWAAIFNRLKKAAKEIY